IVVVNLNDNWVYDSSPAAVIDTYSVEGDLVGRTDAIDLPAGFGYDLSFDEVLAVMADGTVVVGSRLLDQESVPGSANRFVAYSHTTGAVLASHTLAAWPDGIEIDGPHGVDVTASVGGSRQHHRLSSWDAAVATSVDPASCSDTPTRHSTDRIRRCVDFSSFSETIGRVDAAGSVLWERPLPSDLGREWDARDFTDAGAIPLATNVDESGSFQVSLLGQSGPATQFDMAAPVGSRVQALVPTGSSSVGVGLLLRDPDIGGPYLGVHLVGTSATPPPMPPTVAPSVPSITAVTGGPTPSVTVQASGAPVDATGYRILAFERSSDTPAFQQDVTLESPTATFDSLVPAQLYSFEAQAMNSAGTGPASASTGYVLPPFSTLDAFTDRQHLDFTGVAATDEQRSAWSAALSDGSLTPPQAVDSAVDFAYWQEQSPVIRLYQAYFLRTPDLNGLGFWTNKRRSGMRLTAVSSNFAASNEFKNRYGALSNREFVELVYQNVLGRAGDPSGIAFWTKRLDQRRMTRGQTMASFSESNEFQRKAKPLVDTVNVYTGMLRRVPTSAELATWAPSTGAPSRLELVTAILTSEEYSER
ncbi:MAG: DUF4214 domain-containing protein, partial [Acidimicrobiales bacterium]|nr:DUF4214 domain-containing protein [Acidimicrobiales bacterium]